MADAFKYPPLVATVQDRRAWYILNYVNLIYQSILPAPKRVEKPNDEATAMIE
jgi:hypothetical protein